MAASQHLEKAGCAHAATDAHGHDDPAYATPVSLDQRMADHTRARHPIGVTDRNRTAIDIVPLGIDAESVSAIESLNGERLVELP